MSGYPWKKEATEQRARVAYANVIFEGTRGGKEATEARGELGGKAGGTELEIDPWCSRWDAILFIVLIISEYIVRTRHDAPRSRIREIYAIETTPSPPPVHHHHHYIPLACVHRGSPPSRLSPGGGLPSRRSIQMRVLTRIICCSRPK